MQPAGTPHVQASVNCPQCQRTDQVTKVASLYYNGIASSTHNRARQSQTALSSRLAPPGQSSPNIGGIIVVLGLGAMALVGCALLGTGNVLVIGGGGTAAYLFIGGYFAVLIGVVIFRASRRPTENTRMQVRDMNLALYRWNLLYYCFRDDCVFYPGMNYSLPPEQMTILLNT